MKKTRRVAVPALGVVRQRTGNDAPEGAATDCVNLRLKDGALRPIGDAEQLTTLPANASAQAVLFHSALPDGEYLCRVGTIVYHRKATGDVAVMDFAGESFVSWKAFGTALIVVTSKYTRVAVLKDGAWVCIPTYNGDAPSISQNITEGNTVSTYSYSPYIDFVIDGGLDVGIEKDSTNEPNATWFYKIISQMREKGMIHGFYLAIACIKLSDGTVISTSIPVYVQHGCMYDYNVDGNGHSYTGLNNTINHTFSFLANSLKTYVYNSLVDNKQYCTIVGGPVFSKPTLTISIPDDLKTYINTLRMLNMISSIAIYATKKKDLYNFKKCWRDYNNIESGGYIYKSSTQTNGYYGYKWNPILNEINPEEPFYLLKEFPIASDVASSISVNLTPDDFDNQETKEVLRANGSRHAIRSMFGVTEYNSRIHASGIASTLSQGDAIPSTLNSCQYLPENYYGYTPYSTTLFTAYLETTIPIDGINHVVKKDIPINTVLFRKGDGTSADTKFAIILPPIVAYPDARATLMRLILVNGSGSHFEAMNIPLKACLEGNFAYAKGTNTDINVTQPPFLKVIEPKLTSRWDANLQVEVSEWVFSSDSLPTIPNPPAESREFSQTNRLQVYNYGSPLTYELKNSYRFGASTERLLRCEAAVDQLSEGRFGQFPLYCFTDCGLYALEQGSGEVLYATSHPISADGLISSEGVTPVRGGVAFVTSKGVMFVSGRQVVELSGPIRGTAEYYDATTGLPDVFRFMDVSAALGGPQEPALKTYLAGAELHQLYNEGELIAYNRQYAYAWVYGMESKMWYRRQLPYTNIQRVGTSLLCYSIQATSLYRANIEREQGYSSRPMLYISRPLEFGSNGYKKLEGAMARISSTSGGLVRICILGSIDGVRYGKIQGATVVAKDNTISDIMLGRSGISVRSVVVAILFDANMRTAVERFDFELEDRFTSRLR